MSRQMTYPILLITLMLVLSACSIFNTSPVPSVSPQATTAPAPTYALATPYASEPAAGICASFDGSVVTITINVDAPSPRCAKVRSDQTLAVVNATLSSIQISIGDFSTSVLPGATYSLTVPFGDYLAVGVHQLTVTPYFGAELWLEGK